jgi:hypothetical protein
MSGSGKNSPCRDFGFQSRASPWHAMLAPDPVAFAFLSTAITNTIAFTRHDHLRRDSHNQCRSYSAAQPLSKPVADGPYARSLRSLFQSERTLVNSSSDSRLEALEDHRRVQTEADQAAALASRLKLLAWSSSSAVRLVRCTLKSAGRHIRQTLNQASRCLIRKSSTSPPRTTPLCYRQRRPKRNPSWTNCTRGRTLGRDPMGRESPTTISPRGG